MALYLGIDSGGTKTSCCIGNETAVLAQGHAGGSNLLRAGEAKAREALHEAIQQACLAANAAPDQVAKACIGAAGAGRPEIAGRIRKIAKEILTCEVEVVGDMVIALQAAFGDGPGVIVIAGTGSIAYGRDDQDNIARAGGWGAAVSDEGSGHWIGRHAVQAVLRARDQNQPTALLEAVMKVFHADTPDQLVIIANASPAPDFASLVPAVLSAAASGDASALNVLTLAGEELARLATIVIEKLKAQGNIAVAMAGGVFAYSPIVRKVFSGRVASAHPTATISPIIVEPVQGALELARKPPRIAHV